MRTSFAAAALLLASVPTSFALGQKRYIETTSLPGSFPIVRARNAGPIYVDADDYPGVKRAVTDLNSDIAHVTGALQRSAVSTRVRPKRSAIAPQIIDSPIPAGTVRTEPILQIPCCRESL